MDMSRRRQGGRGRRLDGTRVPQLPWTEVVSPYAPMEVLSADQLEAIHLTSLRILENLGMEVMSPRALALLEAAGADVDRSTLTVRLDRGLVESALKTAPASFVLTPRNRDKRVIMGGNHINFGLVAGPPNVHDCERGRRPGNYSDYCDFIRLAQYFNAIHLIGNQVCAPIEMPANSRHLDTYLANLVYSDQVFHCTAIGAGRALDGIRMMAIARGLSLEQMAADPGVITIISVNSPRRFDEAMSDGLIAMAQHGRSRRHYSLHADGSDGAGVARGGACSAERRGLIRRRARPDGSSRHTGDVRRLHLQRRHALGSPRIRHA